MAETFGAVAGALSVVALFNNCVDCFEYIQLGRHFGEDYERYQLKLDVVRARLARWGQAVRINDDAQFATDTPSDKTARLVKIHLGTIVHIFEILETRSRAYEIDKEPDDLVLLKDSNFGPLGFRLHNRIREVVRWRQQQTSLFKKTKWALYEERNFEKLVRDVKELVDDLEKLVPVSTGGAARRHLAVREIEDVKDKQSLSLLNDAARGIDSTLCEVVEEKMSRIEGRNHVGDIRAEEAAMVRLGDEIGEVVFIRGVSIVCKTRNSAETVTANGESTVNIGNRIGVRGNLES